MDDKRVRFETQVLPHLDAAYRFARWLSRSPDDVDDLVQEAMMRAYRGFDTLHGSNVKAWLLAIVRNCHATARRQTQRRAWVPLPSDEDAKDGHAMISKAPGPDGDAARRELARALDRLLADLPEDHREVLVLREIEDMSYREIAEIAGVPIGTVMSRLNRARAMLKAHWTSHLGGAT
jgi:RNA polymerase sigma-70 factor (ECF subfamily)